MNLDLFSFAYGFLIGFVAAGIMGALLRRIGEALNAVQAPDRPMTISTTQTPRHVMQRAARAWGRLMLLVFWLVIWVVVVGAFVVYLFF
jgi:ABC-type antimicrobial peptide transport system permease subunit